MCWYSHIIILYYYYYYYNIISILYTVGVRPCATAKLPVSGPWFWNLLWIKYGAVGRVRCKHHVIGRCKMWNCRFIKHLRAAYDPKPGWRIIRQFFLFPCKAHLRDATLPPIPISDATNKPKTSPYTRLSWSWRSFLCCRDVDRRCPMKADSSFQSLQSRRFEALRGSARPDHV